MCRYRYKYKTRKHKDQNFVTTMLEEQKQKKNYNLYKKYHIVRVKGVSCYFVKKLCKKF